MNKIDENSGKKEVLAIVSKLGWNLKFASKKLQDDAEVVSVAVKNYGWALQYASSRLQSHRTIVLDSVIQDHQAFQYCHPKFYDDKEIVMLVVKKYGYYLKLASPRLKADWEIVIAALIQNSNVLKYADASIQEKEDLLLYNLGESLTLLDDNGKYYQIYNWLSHSNLLDLVRQQIPAKNIADLEVNGFLVSENTAEKIKAELVFLETGPEAKIIYVSD